MGRECNGCATRLRRAAIRQGWVLRDGLWSHPTNGEPPFTEFERMTDTSRIALTRPSLRIASAREIAVDFAARMGLPLQRQEGDNGESSEDG